MATRQFQYPGVQHLFESLDRYAENHIPTGDFLKAVLGGDLYEAVARADSRNLANLREICSYIQNNLPSDSFGSRAAVISWIKEKPIAKPK